MWSDSWIQSLSVQIRSCLTFSTLFTLNSSFFAIKRDHFHSCLGLFSDLNVSLGTNHSLSGFLGWDISKAGGWATTGHLSFCHLHCLQVPLSNTKFQSSLFSASYSLAIKLTFIKHLLCAVKHLPNSCKRDCSSSPGAQC